MLRARNGTRNTVLAEEVEMAETLWQRMRGLLGRSSLPTGQALWIRPCQSIHTFFMRFPIDALFLSEEDRVVRAYPSLAPFRVTTFVAGAHSVLELPVGALSCARAEVGDQLIFEPVA
jgi:uncharacterized protein